MGTTHVHDHSDHPHGHVHAAGAVALRTAFFINLAFTVVELVGGWWTGSIAVLTDAMHDAGDCLVLGAAWYLQRVALKGRDAHYSYGYGRYSMLGGWLTERGVDHWRTRSCSAFRCHDCGRRKCRMRRG